MKNGTSNFQCYNKSNKRSVYLEGRKGRREGGRAGWREEERKEKKERNGERRKGEQVSTFASLTENPPEERLWKYIRARMHLYFSSDL